MVLLGYHVEKYRYLLEKEKREYNIVLRGLQNFMFWS